MRATVVRMEDAFSQSPESLKCRFHKQFKYPVGALSDLFCGESTNQMKNSVLYCSSVRSRFILRRSRVTSAFLLLSIGQNLVVFQSQHDV